ncbi:MAG: peptidase U35 [Novosphingobium sp. 28-62-57]|uniref:HK97 family phage prohead protease n=1 Tax=unclassified Novosphingobium TaxID=2644732 RepID=UPI000BC91C10|nr:MULTISPECIES: HK97 family phage prohead protease [unclassified Novosphingobium]OYW48448.1 MAG: peptidase U35 [Novosphingobium sp. 12-62-10]OYZ09297.1 MAG: peptidase U35 [Novosphingobium sp. 28-62-57]OZA32568.1 MAG: peptidase U35 [Novosphingobium sp. 17-62-9]HQS71455.1 HK97 family phage prohead protease [Novosphingobium sp.]
MKAPIKFAGYAAIFRRRDSGGDTIMPGAFKGSLERRLAEGLRLPLLWQHRPDQQIGWIESAGEDERGLRVVARVDATDSAAARALTQGAVDGLSFGYRVLQGRALPGGRELNDLEIIEVSLVTRPMQPLARVHYVEGAEQAEA